MERSEFFSQPSMAGEVKADDEASFQHMKQVAREHNKEKYLELDRMFESIDLSKIQKIIQDLAARCGIKSEKVNFVGTDRVVLWFGESSEGVYFPDSNSIGLSLEQIKNAATYYGRRQPPEYSAAIIRLVFLKTLFHEEIHAASFHQTNEENLTVSGYQVSVYDNQGGWSELYEALDEGTTEMAARSLLAEYLKEDPELARVQTAINFFGKLKSGPSSYGTETTLVDVLITKIAATSGMSEETVQQAIMRSKLEGVDLAETELAQFMDEQTYAGFSEDIKRLQPARRVDELEKAHTCLSLLDPGWADKRQEMKRKETNSTSTVTLKAA